MTSLTFGGKLVGGIVTKSLRLKPSPGAPGFRDVLTLGFWLSGPALAAVNSAGYHTRSAGGVALSRSAPRPSARRRAAAATLERESTSALWHTFLTPGDLLAMSGRRPFAMSFSILCTLGLEIHAARHRVAFATCSWQKQLHSATTTTARHICSRHKRSAIFRLMEQDDRGAEGGDSFEPTWTYTPYKPPPKRPNQRRSFSTRRRNGEWKVPEHITIPENELQISFARASGAGGQNVNKVNTKVEIRFHLPSADWIPAEVRDRLQSNEANRINNEGYMSITSQEHRTQMQNRKDAMKKLQDMVRRSWARPKVRKMRKGPTRKAKEKRLENKKKNSLKKQSRGRLDF